jgi:hypothetical protein
VDNHLKPSTGYSSITSRWVGVVDISFASYSGMFVPRAAEQRRAYRRKYFIPDEEDNSISDKHVYNRSSDQRVERWADLGGHRYIPRSMLCRGMYEQKASKIPYGFFP